MAKQIDIQLKKSFLESWKESMSVDDIEPIEGVNFNSIFEYEPPIGSKKDTYAIISYSLEGEEDSDINKRVFIEFEKSKSETIKEIISPSNFIVDPKKLNSYDAVTINEYDISLQRDEIQLNNVEISPVKLHDMKVTLKLSVEVFNFKTIVFVEKQFNTNIFKRLLSMVSFDKNNTSIQITDDLKPNFTEHRFILIENKRFEREDERFQEFLNGIKVSGLTYQGSEYSFAKEAIGEFNVQISSKGFSARFVYRSTYDTGKLFSELSTIINALPLREEVKGGPKPTLEMWKVFEPGDDLLVGSKRSSLLKMIRANFRVVTETYTGEQKQVRARVESSMIEREERGVIREITLNFEKTAIEQIKETINENDFVLFDQSILMNTPRWDLSARDFISIVKDFKIVLAKPLSEENELDSKVVYQLEVQTSGDFGNLQIEKTLNFAYSFGYKKFQSIEIDAIDDKSVEEYTSSEFIYNRKKQWEDQVAWLPLTKEEVDSIIIDESVTKLGVVLKRAWINDRDKRKGVILLRAELFQPDFGSRTIQKAIQKPVLKYDKKYNELTEDSIKLENKELLNHYPVPFLEPSDFSIEHPFEISRLVTRYYDDSKTIDCYFEVKYYDDVKEIKKTLYFEGAMKYENEEIDPKKLRSINRSVSASKVLVDYDPNQENYHINPKFDFVHEYPNTRVVMESYSLKKNGAATIRAVALTGEFRKNIKLKAQFRKPLSKVQFEEWKEVNNV